MSWQDDIDDVWARAGDLDEDELVAQVAAAVRDAPADVAQYEIGGSYDNTGRPDVAEGHYREALDLGLDGPVRVQCLIQLASSIRNLGRPEESLALLDGVGDPHHLGDAVAAFRALVLADLGREREGLSLVLQALAPHLPRYQRSAAAYGRALVE